jgi:hypothetical protein
MQDFSCLQWCCWKLWALEMWHVVGQAVFSTSKSVPSSPSVTLQEKVQILYNIGHFGPATGSHARRPVMLVTTIYCCCLLFVFVSAVITNMCSDSMGTVCYHLLVLFVTTCSRMMVVQALALSVSIVDWQWYGAPDVSSDSSVTQGYSLDGQHVKIKAELSLCMPWRQTGVCRCNCTCG